MKITISKQEILNEVERRISVESSIIPDKFDLLWVNTNKKELLSGYWIEGCESVISLFRNYIIGQTIDHSLDKYDSDEQFSISVIMPGRYNSSFDSSINTDVKMMVACNITYRWFNAVYPDISEKYILEANGYANNIKNKINYRKPNESDMYVHDPEADELNTADSYEFSTKSDDVDINQIYACQCQKK